MKRFFAVVLSGITFLSVFLDAGGVQASTPPKESELYAKSAVLMDADSGCVLYAKDAENPMANASTTKILTCILTLENCDLGSEVTVSSHAASQPKVRLGMREGQKFYLRDLLYGLMLESFNDCAVAIAEYVAGTTEGFAAMMNDKAKEIGCTDTYFITPNGLDASDANGFHHTTATDLARIMRYCISQSPKAEEFLALTQAADYSFADVEKKSSYSCVNHNAFLQMMEGAISGKTGFTGNAGYCYVGALKRENRTYIVALLACGWPNNKSYKWADTKKLMNYGIENFVKKRLAEYPLEERYLQPVEVENGQGKKIGEQVCVPVEVREAEGVEELLVEKDQEITVSYDVVKRLAAPVEKNMVIGRICYRLGDEILKECQVVTTESAAKIDFFWCSRRVLELLWFS